MTNKHALAHRIPRLAPNETLVQVIVEWENEEGESMRMDLNVSSEHAWLGFLNHLASDKPMKYITNTTHVLP